MNMYISNTECYYIDTMYIKQNPADSCIFCAKTWEQIGGKRLFATAFKGAIFSDEDQTHIKCDTPRKGYIADSTNNIYLNIWGNEWNEDSIEKALLSYKAFKHPWFCQVCGDRTCSRCGSPVRFPMGSDVIHVDGETVHSSILPTRPRCININCKEYINTGE